MPLTLGEGILEALAPCRQQYDDGYDQVSGVAQRPGEETNERA